MAYEKLKKFTENKGINTVHAEKEAIKLEKKESKDKKLTQDDYNELTKIMAKSLGFLE